MADSFGKLFRVTTWGESHGPAIGAVIEGCPPLLPLDCRERPLYVKEKSGRALKIPAFTSTEIQSELDRRRPGQSGLTTPRREPDQAHILSGIFEGKTTGAPISILAWNSDVRPEDYEVFKSTDRPGHAGFTYRAKYGVYDHRGGGRSSYRETWGRVAAGAVAKKLLKRAAGTEIVGYVARVADVAARVDPNTVTLKQVESHATRCPDPDAAERMSDRILAARESGDSLGGVVGIVVRNVPKGLGEPVFDKLDADLFKALKSIHATKAVEIGAGLEAAGLMGSEHNDPFTTDPSGRVRPLTNQAGGVLGGISTGENLILRVTFKPTATIRKPQATVTVKGKKTVLSGAGRHDPCVLPRAVVTAEAMVALVLADHYLRDRAIAPFSGR